MPGKLLVADDDMDTLRLVGLMLERQGYAILAASNGNQALGLAKREQPDLILLDVMMPDMDGALSTKGGLGVTTLAGHNITVVFTPAPELAYQASVYNIPIVTQLPDSLNAEQFFKLADNVTQRGS